MRIAVIGYSGCGKSTLARELGKRYDAPVLHLDSVHFLPDWEEREPEDEQRIVEDFLDGHDSWVIDGNYSSLSYQRRLKEADRIVVMLFNRFSCLLRVIRRYRLFHDQSRPDMADGCAEKLDGEFAAWVLWNGRKKKRRDRFKAVIENYPDKAVVLKNQKELDAFMARDGISG